MRLTVLQQTAKGFPPTTHDDEGTYEVREPVRRALERLKWFLWHGSVYQALQAVMVTLGSRGARRLRAWQLHPGHAVDLGMVHRRQERAVPVRVVGVWAPTQPEPWWWAIDLLAPLEPLVALYDWRMTVEEPCRDTQGGRLGVRLAWTPCRTPAYWARLTLVVGVALGLGTAVGQAVAMKAPRVRLPCQRQGPRLSLLRVGIQFVAMLALRVYIGVRLIRTHLPPPQFRRCRWLQTRQEVS